MPQQLAVQRNTAILCLPQAVGTHELTLAGKLDKGLVLRTVVSEYDG